MRTWWHWGLGLGGILLAHTASAEQADRAPAISTRDELPEQPAPPPRAAPPRERWYGWQIMLSDLASLTLGVASSQSWLGAAGYLVAPPLLHVFHGQGTRALASTGMRIGLPLVGYAIAFEGSGICSPRPSFSPAPSGCEIGLGVLGFVVAISAVGLDPAFSYEPVESKEQPRSSFAPQILISDREARFGLVGSF